MLLRKMDEDLHDLKLPQWDPKVPTLPVCLCVLTVSGLLLADESIGQGPFDAHNNSSLPSSELNL